MPVFLPHDYEGAAVTEGSRLPAEQVTLKLQILSGVSILISFPSLYWDMQNGGYHGD
jgi:hypothetical protein